MHNYHKIIVHITQKVHSISIKAVRKTVKTLFFDAVHSSRDILTYKCMHLHHQPNLMTDSTAFLSVYEPMRLFSSRKNKH